MKKNIKSSIIVTLLLVTVNLVNAEDLNKDLTNNYLKEVTDGINENYKKEIELKNDKIEDFTKVILKDAVYEALSQSNSLKETKEDIVKAKLKLKDAKADYLPKIDFEYSEEGTRTDPSTDKSKSFDRSRIDKYNLELNQNIYDGGLKDSVLNRRILELEQNEVLYKIKINDEIKKAIKAYLDVVFSKKSVEVNERNIVLLEKIEEIISMKYEAGAASLPDLNSVKASVSSAKASLEKVKSTYSDSLKYYEYTMGKSFVKTLPIEENYEIKLTEFKDLYETALIQNPTIKNITLTQKIAEEKIKEGRSAFKPTVDFTLGYQKENDFTSQLEDYKPTQEVKGTLSVKYNFYNKGNDERNLLKARSDIRKTDNTKLEEEKKLKWNLEKLYDSVASTKTISTNTKNEVLSLRLMIKQYWERFTTGEQDLQDLLSGQKQLNSAELEYIKYQSSLLQDFFNVLYYTGDLLNYFGIDSSEESFLSYDKNALKKEEILQDTKNKKNEETKKETKIVSYDISSFYKDFIKAEDNLTTIQIKGFKNVYEIYSYLDEKGINNNYLMYVTYEDNQIKHNLLIGLYNDRKEAKNEIKEKNIEGSKIIELKEAKPLLTNYNEGVKVNKIKEVTTVTINKLEKETTIKKPVSIKLNDEFKTRFLEANDEMISIYLGSFNTFGEAIAFSKENNIYEKTFIYKTTRSSTYELMYGLFKEDNEAISEAKKLKIIEDRGYIISKIGFAKNSYKESELNKIYSAKTEYEIEKIEKTEPIIISTEKNTKEEIEGEKNGNN